MVLCWCVAPCLGDALAWRSLWHVLWAVGGARCGCVEVVGEVGAFYLWLDEAGLVEV